MEKVAIGCLPSVPLKVAPVLGKTRAAKKGITVDGCPFQCSRRTINAAGFKITKTIVLVKEYRNEEEGLAPIYW